MIRSPGKILSQLNTVFPPSSQLGWGGGGEGGVAQLVEPRTGTLPTQVRFPSAARDFSPRVNFQCRLFYGVRKHPCATACTNICVHVKDLVVHARVRWIIETLKHPSCTVDWVARLCRSWLSRRKVTRISHGKKSHWDNTVVKQINELINK